MSGRRLILNAFGDLRVQEGPEPALPGPREVILAPAAVGICGSDVHGYAGTSGRRSPGMVMGHEAAGRIESVGPGVEGLAPGASVALNPVVTCGKCDACRSGRDNLCEQRRLYGCVPGLDGAFADRMVVRADNVVALRGGAPLEYAALAEPLAVGTHAVRIAGVGPGSRVLVVGGGPIGAGAALAARRAGAERVLVSEPETHRRAVLTAMGLDAVEPAGVPPQAAEVALECVGLPATTAAALEGVEPGATVVMVGITTPELVLPSAALVMGERRLVGSAVYTRSDFEKTVASIDAGELDVGPLIEARVTLPEVIDAFAGYSDGSLTAMKTLWIEPAIQR